MAVMRCTMSLPKYKHTFYIIYNNKNLPAKTIKQTTLSLAMISVKIRNAFSNAFDFTPDVVRAISRDES